MVGDIHKDVLGADLLLRCLSDSERQQAIDRDGLPEAMTDPWLQESDSGARLLSDRQTRAIVQFIVRSELAAGTKGLDIANRLLNEISYNGNIDQRVRLLDNLTGLVSQYEDFLDEVHLDYYGKEECSRIRTETLAMIDADLRALSTAYSALEEEQPGAAS